jgi:hypothetical protein
MQMTTIIFWACWANFKDRLFNMLFNRSANAISKTSFRNIFPLLHKWSRLRRILINFSLYFHLLIDYWLFFWIPIVYLLFKVFLNFFVTDFGMLMSFASIYNGSTNIPLICFFIMNTSRLKLEFCNPKQYFKLIINFHYY